MTRTGPLSGKRVVVTRASHQAVPLADALSEAGASVVIAPAIAIVPPLDGGQSLDDALLRLRSFSWVAFTSTNAAAATFARADRRGVRKHFGGLRSAAVGPQTAARVESELGRPVDTVPATHTASALADAFGEPTSDDHCFVPMAYEGRPDLREGLERRGWQVTTATAYRTVHPSLPGHLLGEVIDADLVVFASPSAVEGHLDQLAEHGETLRARVVCIGPTTEDACERLGITPAAVADTPSTAALISAAVGCI